MPEAIYQLRRKMETMPKTHKGRNLNAFPSNYDPRNIKYTNIISLAGYQTTTPTTIDYRPNLPDVFDQGQRGSCVPSAIDWTVKAIDNLSQGDFPANGFSVAFHYALCKTIDGLSGEEGTTPLAAMKILQTIGVCPEDTMPYSTLTKLQIPQVPVVSESAKLAANKYKINSYAQICSPSDKDRSNIINTMRQALINEGPFLIAVLVCENFIPDKDNKLPLPQGQVQGGHGIGVVGDLPSLECFIVRNSWGKNWSQNGYALMPYKWFTSRCDICWYVFEAWTATSLFIPKSANRIEITPGFKSMIVDGLSVALDQPAVIDPTTNRTVLPVRSLASNMGYVVQFVGNKIVLTKPN